MFQILLAPFYTFFVICLSPLQVLGVWLLSAFGFSSTGISLGSYAASWMSSIALANGGAVAGGSVFSMLQAFGASAVYPPIAYITSGLIIYAAALGVYMLSFFQKLKQAFVSTQRI